MPIAHQSLPSFLLPKYCFDLNKYIVLEICITTDIWFYFKYLHSKSVSGNQYRPKINARNIKFNISTAWKVHGIPWNLRAVPWNSMEFHGTLCSSQMVKVDFHGIPWNSMDLNGIPGFWIYGLKRTAPQFVEIKL